MAVFSALCGVLLVIEEVLLCMPLALQGLGVTPLRGQILLYN